MIAYLTLYQGHTKPISRWVILSDNTAADEKAAAKVAVELVREWHIENGFDEPWMKEHGPPYATE